MKKLQFKTNINCSGCVEKVAPGINEIGGILSWKVDTASPGKVLKVETEAVSAAGIIKAVNKAGFKIQEF